MTIGRKLVLVADDYDHAAAIVAEYLRAAGGFDTMVAKDGRQAVEQAMQRPPDAAVLDLDMPFLGGLDAARRLRDELGEHRPLLIAVTGGPIDGAIVSGMFDHVLKKPFDFGHLLRLLADA